MHTCMIGWAFLQYLGVIVGTVTTEAGTNTFNFAFPERG